MTRGGSGFQGGQARAEEKVLDQEQGEDGSGRGPVPPLANAFLFVWERQNDLHPKNVRKGGAKFLDARSQAHRISLKRRQRFAAGKVNSLSKPILTC